MARKAPTAGPIVKLKVTLARLRPPVWRRLLVPADMTLRDLHFVIQTVMGWDNDHLHDFNIADEHFGDPDTTDEMADEARLNLAGVRNRGVERFTYTYDFGDDWEHLIVMEGTVKRVEGQHYPACIAGKRACPPEDCGGVHGYYELLDIRADPTHPDHKEMSERLPADFDPEAFSVEAADAAQAAQFSPARPAKR
jgi:hypothetical protein